MPRQTNTQKTRRVAVGSSDVANSLSRALSPQSFGAGSNRLGELAKALEISAPTVGGFIDRKNQADTDEARADFQTGTLQDGKSRAYNTAATKLRAEADWVKTVPKLDQALDELDLDNMTPDELSQSIDSLYREQYEGLDDPDEAGIVIPLMEKYREGKVAEYQKRQQDIVFASQTADLETLFKDRYARVKGFNEASRAEGGREIPFDYTGFHQQIKSMDFGGKVTNEVFYSIVANQAIENGDPELLDRIPDKWKDGTPSIKHIPAFNERMLNASVRAEARQLSLINATLKAQDSAAKEVRREAGIILVEKLTGDISDDERNQLISDYSQLEGSKPESIISLYNASRSFTNDSEKRAINYNGVTLLTHGVYEGTKNAEDIFTAYAEGTLGHPGSQDALELFRQLNTDLRNSESLSKSGNKDKFNAYLKGLSGKFVPNGLLSETNGATNALRSDAEFAYRKAVFDEGLSPSAAYKKTIDEFLPQLNNAQETVGGSGTPASQALRWRNAVGEERDIIVSSLAATTGISSSLQSLVTTGVLSEPEATQLLLEINSYIPTQ